MLEDPQMYLLVLALSVSLYWAIPVIWPRARSSFLLGVSLLYVYMLSPPAFALSVGMSLAAFAGGRLFSRPDRWRPVQGPAFWLLSAGIVAAFTIVPVELAYSGLPPESRYLPQFREAAAIGLSYVALRSLGVLINARWLGGRQPPPGLSDILLLNFCFPAFTAGPIEDLKPFSREAFSSGFSLHALVDGLMRISIGLLKICFVYGEVLGPILDGAYGDFYAEPERYSIASAHAFIWLSFLALYFNFSGYADIAVGSGRLFNLPLSENFDYPFIAANIQTFWKRWHVTLGSFAFRFIFFPLVKRTRGRTALSIFLTFVAVGLWHGRTPGFVLWGVSHGLALALVPALDRVPAWRSRKDRPHFRMLSWAITMSFVAWAWSAANSPSLSDAWLLTAKLLGSR